MRNFLYLGFFLLTHTLAFAQTESPGTPDRGQLSGNFQTNNQFYQRDDRIGANTTQYLREKSSTDAWLFLNYKLKGYNFMLRFDVFNNSPLFNPQEAYSAQGIGIWQISKDIEKLNITGGYIYDQFGSGMTFRAFEDRNIGIDFALYGVRVTYDISENTKVKAITGRQKNRFVIREPVIKGLHIEHSLPITQKLSFDMGGSIVNRTLDQATMNAVANTINSYPIEDRFDPKYNEYAFQVYNTFRFQKVNILVEYCYKTEEAIMDQTNQLILSDGNIIHTSISYSDKGIGINAQYKRMNAFPFRNNPLEIAPPPNNGPINYLTSVTRQNTYRLLARYNAVPQELGENAGQLELTLKPSKKTQININTSAVVTLKGVDFSNMEVKWDSTTRLFREFYFDITHKFNNSFKALFGVQFIGYNQQVYEAKPNAPWMQATTPFGEFTYKLNKKKSLRFEWQWMNTEGDLGSFVNGLLEYNMAPHWSFSVGDLLNYSPGAINKPAAGETFEYIHYFNFFGAYTYKTTRFTGGYLKQPQGVNCTGGVCRVEPAFSGVRVTLTTNF
jgi:hypothetical protein